MARQISVTIIRQRTPLFARFISRFRKPMTVEQWYAAGCPDHRKAVAKREP